MARAMWKAGLEIGRTILPVKLYAAVEDHSVHFRLLHRGDHVPVKQKMVDPRTGEEVASDQIQRGIEVDKGLFVLLKPEDLARFEPKQSRNIEVTRFVPPSALDPSWYYRPYFLGPDGSDADYVALVEALRAADRVGIARWVMRGKRYFGALIPHETHLALVSMHSVNEVVPASALPRPEGPAIKREERALAEQLVSTLDAKFDPSELKDEYRDRVLAFVEAKAKGKKLTVKEAPAPRKVSDLTAALKRSVRAAKEARHAAA